MNLEFKHLREIDTSEIIALNTHPLVRRYMPLMNEDFDEVACREWVECKEKQWDQFGYGPWAFVVDGKFAGWGGLQEENGDADLGLVLHPDFWGMGKTIFDEILRRAFEEMRLESVTIMLPVIRPQTEGISRLGFHKEGEVELEGERFFQYRVYATNNKTIKT